MSFNRHLPNLDSVNVYAHCPSCGKVRKVYAVVDGNKFTYAVTCGCYWARPDNVRWVVDPTLTPGARGSLTAASASVLWNAEALWLACQTYADWISKHYEKASCRCTLSKLLAQPSLVCMDPAILLGCKPRTPLSPGLLQWLNLAR